MRRAIAALALVAVSCASSYSEGPVRPAQTTTAPSDLPSPSKKVLARFAVIGDFGAGTEAQYELAERMCRWRKSHHFNLVITTGDNIYPSGARKDFRDNFFIPYDCLFDRGVRFRATLGNHDIVADGGESELEEERFGLKARNYVVRRSRPNHTVRFVMWNANRANRQWLRKHLGSDDWTIVAFHHPVFSPGPHGPTPGFAPSLPRLFRRKDVDLVLNGHDHLYARMPARSRVRYVVSGGGGAGLYSCEDPDAAEVCISRYHFLYVVVHSNQIVVRAIPIRGEPFGYFRTGGRD